MLRLVPLILCCLLAACDVPAPAPSGAAAGGATSTAGQSFASVVARVEPVAEAECRRQAPDLDCDFQIVVDRRADSPNAFQTRDRQGRPIIVFNRALIEDARNADELAFILGHEAAHHIARHLERTQVSARVGAVLLGTIAQAAGQSASQVRAAARVGEAVGARRYSKQFELEADSLGTRIAHLAGFDPVRGSQFFNRVPDPGDQFLGSHPPNAERLARVRAEAAKL